MTRRTAVGAAIGAAAAVAAAALLATGGERAPAAALAGPADGMDAALAGFRAVVEGVRPRGFGQGEYERLEPAPGARAYWVDPAGDDGGPGTRELPFRTIDRAARAARAGDVVTIRDGTYRESVRVRHGGTPERRIVFQAENRGGVVLTGGRHTFAPEGWNASVMQSGPVHVTLRGLVFREYSLAASRVPPPQRPAVGAVRGWRIEDCLFDRPGHDGLMIRGDDVQVVRSTFQYSHTHALTAGTGASPRLGPGAVLERIDVVDVVLRGNHTRPDPFQHPVATRVVKFMNTRHVRVDNLESTGNRGPGWWFDRYNSHYVIRDSYIHGNVDDLPGATNGRGIYLEVNLAPGRVENNVIARNAREAISVANSRGVRVVGNLMVANERCVRLVNAERDADYPLHDVDLDGNYCKDWARASAVHPSGVDIGHPSRLGIRADRNTYDPGADAMLTWWPDVGQVSSIAELRTRLGWERDGRIAPIRWPPDGAGSAAAGTGDAAGSGTR